MSFCSAVGNIFQVKKIIFNVGDIVHTHIAGGHYAVVVAVHNQWALLTTITHKPGRHGGRFQIPGFAKHALGCGGPSYFWPSAEWYPLSSVKKVCGHLDEPQARELVKSIDLDYESGYEFVNAVLNLAA